MLVFRGVYWSSVFSGLSRKKKVTSYYKKYGCEEISVPSNTFPKHSDLWARFPPNKMEALSVPRTQMTLVLVEKVLV